MQKRFVFHFSSTLFLFELFYFNFPVPSCPARETRKWKANRWMDEEKKRWKNGVGKGELQVRSGRTVSIQLDIDEADELPITQCALIN